MIVDIHNLRALSIRQPWVNHILYDTKAISKGFTMSFKAELPN
jgi:hypothetical protein